MVDTPEEPETPEPQRPSLSDIDARLHAVEQLIRIFRLERYIYLAISIASFVVIIVFASYVFATTDDKGRGSLIALLFAAPSGALLYVSAAFLKMWTQALQVLGGKAGS